MARFIYSAKAVGVAANFGGPNGVQRFWASRALPIIGGVDQNRGELGPSGHPVLNFAWAETELSGIETAPGVHETKTRVTVDGLNILNGAITASLVSVTVTWRCDLATRNRAIAVVGANGTQNPFVNLMINGVAVNIVNLDAPAVLPALGAGLPGAGDPLADLAARRYEPLFRAQLPVRRPGAIRKRPREARPAVIPPDPAPLDFHTGFAHLALPHAQITDFVAPDAFGVYNGLLPAGIAQISLCEWFAEPDRQNLTIMRVKLAAPNAGEIVICDPDDDGKDVP